MRKTKSSPAHAAAARANGARSNGPKTAAGKKRSSQNSIKHACSGCKVATLLPGEDVAKLQAYTNAYYLHFRPRDLAEASIVDQLITQLWRSLRVVGFETEMMTSTAEDLHPTLADEYQSIGLNRLFALAFNAAAGKYANPLANRYMVAARNMFRSALADLDRMRRLAGDPGAPFVQPPQLPAPGASLCIDPSVLPVPDAESLIVPMTPETPDTADTVDDHPANDPWPESAQPEPESTMPPPQPAPDPEPEFVPMPDKRGGFVKTLVGTPVMMRNPKWVPPGSSQPHHLHVVPPRDTRLPNEPKPPQN